MKRPDTTIHLPLVALLWASCWAQGCVAEPDQGPMTVQRLAPQAVESTPEARRAAVAAWRGHGARGGVVDLTVGRWWFAPLFDGASSDADCAPYRAAPAGGVVDMAFVSINLRTMVCHGERTFACGPSACCGQHGDPDDEQIECSRSFLWEQTLRWHPSGLTEPLRSWEVGATHGCGLDAAGHVQCVGPGPDLTPVADEVFVQMGTASPDLACGLRADGTVRCWGSEAEGPLGAIDGQYIDQCVTPFHWCGLTAEGEVRCVGEDLYGETQVPAGPVYGALTCAQEITCVAEVEGEVSCHGRFSRGVMRPPPGLRAWRLRMGTRLACALTPEPGYICWGDQAIEGRADGRIASPPLSEPFKVQPGWDGHQDAGVERQSYH